MLVFVAIFCSLFARVARADLPGTFTYPVENGLVFYDGETIDVSWTSTLSNASLTLFCRNGTETSGTTYQINSIGSTEVYVNFRQSSDYCWLNLYETGNNADGVNSVTFILSSDYHSETTLGITGVATTSYAGTGVPTGPVTAATTATATATSTGTATTIKGSVSTTATEAATNTATASSSSGNLSTGAKAGIGAGVGVASLAVLGAFLLWFLRRKRVRRNGQDLSEGQEGMTKEKAMLLDAGETGGATGTTWQPEVVHEMRGDKGRPYELHASTGHTVELAG
ncbi:unnamed protein product [Penicillium glandicola]